MPLIKLISSDTKLLNSTHIRFQARTAHKWNVNNEIFNSIGSCAVDFVKSVFDRKCRLNNIQFRQPEVEKAHDDDEICYSIYRGDSLLCSIHLPTCHAFK